jgi:nucleotide-binding universal stress UspA family protein
MDDPRPDASAAAIPGAKRLALERAGWLPWGISLAIHAALIVSGFFIVWSVSGPSGSRAPVIVSFDEPSPVRLTADPPELSGELGDAALPRIAESAAKPTLSDLVAGLDRNAGGPALPTSGARPDRAKLAGDRRFPEVRFAGMGASNAESIIYVVDASGSMVSTFPFVLDRLEQSVSKLATTQRFQVIFFQRDEAVVAPHPEDDQTLKPKRLIRATKENVRRVLQWSRAVKPAGIGNPVRALQTAAALKPDAIFVLSSVSTGAGVWKPDRDQVLAELEKLNPADPGTGRRPIVIKTIQFINDDPARILRSIGETFGGGTGGYRFISLEEIKSQ